MDVEHVRPLGRYWVLDLPDTKGGTDQYVKIPDHVADEITEMRVALGITSGALWRSLSNNSLHKRLSARSVYSIVHGAAVRAGLSDDVGAHTLRHTGCTLAIESGASVHQVQAHARHKKIETTMVYVHQRDRLRDSAADFIRIDETDE
jgi:site-specific recombinase XerD